MVMSNFVSEAVIGNSITQDGFLEELTENPIIKLVVFIGSVAIAGYFIIMFGKELSAIIFPKAVVTQHATKTFITP